mmetsp:Transcript_41840/g.135290  ORF Transcript_41840/g.135290 Transcript_41840/m.135290 type:complete len:80 (+) Transcript_41840:534-773(+)
MRSAVGSSEWPPRCAAASRRAMSAAVAAAVEPSTTSASGGRGPVLLLPSRAPLMLRPCGGGRGGITPALAGTAGAAAEG